MNISWEDRKLIVIALEVWIAEYGFDANIGGMDSADKVRAKELIKKFGRGR